MFALALRLGYREVEEEAVFSSVAHPLRVSESAATKVSALSALSARGAGLRSARREIERSFEKKNERPNSSQKAFPVGRVFEKKISSRLLRRPTEGRGETARAWGKKIVFFSSCSSFFFLFRSPPFVLFFSFRARRTRHRFGDAPPLERRRGRASHFSTANLARDAILSETRFFPRHDRVAYLSKSLSKRILGIFERSRGPRAA